MRELPISCHMPIFALAVCIAQRHDLCATMTYTQPLIHQRHKKPESHAVHADDKNCIISSIAVLVCACVTCRRVTNGVSR